jgi:hypothetical protein
MEERIEFALKALQTLKKWKERFIGEGLEGMVEEPRRPKSSPEQLAEEEVCEIVRLKLAHLSWGPRKIRELYLRRHGEVASESTFQASIRAGGLNTKAAAAALE